MVTRSSLRQVAPDRLEIRAGGGCVAVFGVPFLLAGLLVVLVGLRVVPVQNAAEVPAWSYPLLVLFGLAFVAVGGGLVFGRRWILLDVGRGRITERWGLLVPLRSAVRALHEFDAVALRVQEGDSDSADSFPVLLQGRRGMPDQPLCSSTAFEEARREAAQIARFLHLPLVDASTEHESVLPPESANTSLRERLRDEVGPPERPARPLHMESQVQESASGVRIRLPVPGSTLGGVLGIAIPLVLLSLVVPWLVRFFEQTRTPAPVQIAFIAFLVLGFGLLPAASALRALIARYRGHILVTAAADGLTLEVRGAVRTRVMRIQAADMLDLDYGTAGSAEEAVRLLAEEKIAEAGPGVSAASRRRARAWTSRLTRLARSKGIVLKTRSGLHTIGAGLPDDEIRYLHALLRQALAGSCHMPQAPQCPGQRLLTAGERS